MKKRTVASILLLATMLLTLTIGVLPVAAASPIAGYGFVESGVLNFADGGWAGWSVPAGNVVLGGGFELTGGPASVSQPGLPGAAYPHYTYGPAEYGWVVRDNSDGANSYGSKLKVAYSQMPPGYEVISSSPMSYGDGGWGGWSAPAGKVVLGGGFEATGPVSVSMPGLPNAVYPHYTYGPDEYGWVVRDAVDSTPNTITIWLVCADAMPGYQVIKSSALNFSDAGWAGWSVPAGKVVLGGGFELSASSAAASLMGTPGSVWPHYTYGADEYGWVVRPAADGISSPDSYVYAIAADAPAPSANLSAAQTTFCAEGATIDINIADIEDMYGYQFKVQYDKDKVSATSEFVNDWFDTTGDALIMWDGTCLDGECRFAVSQQAPGGAPVSGSGTVARITLTALQSGSFDVTMSDLVLADIDGFAIAADSAADVAMTVECLASISGLVSMQGRLTPWDAGTVDVGAYSTGFSAADGSWSITDIAVGPAGTEYALTASHALYMKNAKLQTLMPGANDAGSTQLRGGDIDGDDYVDITDISAIGGVFGTAVAQGTAPDINADGLVNIQDLAIAAGNYDPFTVGPLAW